jgi:hypothetical protein
MESPRSQRKKMPAFQVIDKTSHFEVTDEKGDCYGPKVGSAEEAACLKRDWETYYEAPLNFIPINDTGNGKNWVETAITASEPIKRHRESKTGDLVLSATKSHPEVIENSEDKNTEMSLKVETEPPATGEPSVSVKGSWGRPPAYNSEEERKKEKARKLRISRAWKDRVGLEVYRSMVKAKSPAIHAYPSGAVEQVEHLGRKPPTKKVKSYIPKPKTKYTKGIPYPAFTPELEVQIDVYCVLKDKGFDVHANVPSEEGILDLVVFDDSRNPKIIIEVKAGHLGWAEEQKQKYERLGCDLFLYNASVSKDTLLENVKEALVPAEPQIAS